MQLIQRKLGIVGVQAYGTLNLSYVQSHTLFVPGVPTAVRSNNRLVAVR